MYCGIVARATQSEHGHSPRYTRFRLQLWTIAMQDSGRALDPTRRFRLCPGREHTSPGWQKFGLHGASPHVFGLISTTVVIRCSEFELRVREFVLSLGLCLLSKCPNVCMDRHITSSTAPRYKYIFGSSLKAAHRFFDGDIVLLTVSSPYWLSCGILVILPEFPAPKPIVRYSAYKNQMHPGVMRSRSCRRNPRGLLM